MTTPEPSSAFGRLRDSLTPGRAFRATVWSGLNLVLALGVSILTARMLGPDLRGTLALSITVVAILVLVTGLGTNVVVRRVVPRGTVGIPAYLRLSAKLFVGHIVVTVGVVVVLASFVDPVLADPMLAVPVIVGGCLYFWGLQLGEALNANGRIVASTGSVTAATAVILVGVVISFAAGWGLVAVVISYGAGWAVRCVILLRSLRAYLGGTPESGEERALFVGAPGAVMLGLGQAVAFQAGPIMLAVLSRAAEVGYFAAAASAAAILRLPSVSIGQVLMHDMASGAATPGKVWFRVVQAEIILLAPAALVAVSADWLVPMVLGDGFAAAVPVVRVLLLAELFLAPFMILGRVLVGHGETLGAGATSATGAIAFVALAFVLVPAGGALGAAWASAGAYAAMSIAAMVRFAFAARSEGRPTVSGPVGDIA